jgi:hypothetical protein
VIAVGVPREVIFLQPICQLRRFCFQFFCRFQPVRPSGNTVHALLIETERYDVGARYAIACLGKQPLYAASRVEAKIVAVGTAKHLIDFRLEGNVHRISRLFDDRIENHETTTIFHYTQHFPHHGFRFSEMMQAERDESTIEGIGFERQSIGSAGALIISGNRILVPMADVEHGQRLINPDDPAALKPFRNRSRHSTGAGRQVENYFIPFQRKHVGQFFSEISADLGNSAIKISCVLGIIEPRLVIVSVSMLMSVPVPMIVCVTMFVVVSMCMVVFVRVLVATMLMAVAMSLLVFMRVAVFMATRFMTVLVFLLMMTVAGFMSMIVRFMLVIVAVFVIMFAFVFHFLIHPFFLMHSYLLTPKSDIPVFGQIIL